jgi:hypothetical protein
VGKDGKKGGLNMKIKYLPIEDRKNISLLKKTNN